MNSDGLETGDFYWELSVGEASIELFHPVETCGGIAQLGRGTSFESRVIAQFGNCLSIIISVICGVIRHFFGAIRPNGLVLWGEVPGVADCAGCH